MEFDISYFIPCDLDLFITQICLFVSLWWTVWTVNMISFSFFRLEELLCSALRTREGVTSEVMTSLSLTLLFPFPYYIYRERERNLWQWYFSYYLFITSQLNLQQCNGSVRILCHLLVHVIYRSYNPCKTAQSDMCSCKKVCQLSFKNTWPELLTVVQDIFICDKYNQYIIWLYFLMRYLHM